MAGVSVHQRIVALSVGDKRSEDTKFLWRYAYAHVLEENDRVVVVHARIGAPSGWVPLNVGQAVGSEEAGWLPPEMREGLRAFKHAEYWQLKGLTAAEAVEEFGAPRAQLAATARVAAVAAGRRRQLSWLALTPRALARAVETRGVRPDLLIVGSRGETGLKKALMGSTATHIVATVDVPVLVIRVPVFVTEAPPFRLPTASGAELAAPLPKPDRRRQASSVVRCVLASELRGENGC